MNAGKNNTQAVQSKFIVSLIKSQIMSLNIQIPPIEFIISKSEVDAMGAMGAKDLQIKLTSQCEAGINKL